jgi:hypothetical protein
MLTFSCGSKYCYIDFEKYLYKNKLKYLEIICDAEDEGGEIM